MDFTGSLFDQNRKKAGGHKLRCFPINPGKDALRGVIDYAEEKRLTTFVSQFGGVKIIQPSPALTLKEPFAAIEAFDRGQCSNGVRGWRCREKIGQ